MYKISGKVTPRPQPAFQLILITKQLKLVKFNSESYLLSTICRNMYRPLNFTSIFLLPPRISKNTKECQKENFNYQFIWIFMSISFRDNSKFA